MKELKVLKNSNIEDLMVESKTRDRTSLLRNNKLDRRYKDTFNLH